ncbi:glycosyltransferase [Sphingomonas sp. MMS24-JH45]
MSDDLVATFGAPAGRVRTSTTPTTSIVSLPMPLPRRPAPSPPADPAGGRTAGGGQGVRRPRRHARASPPLPLVILGEGPEQAGLRRRIAAAGLEGRVLLPGFVDDPYAVMGRATALVSVSHNEGFPNAIAASRPRPAGTGDRLPLGPAQLLGAPATAAGAVVKAPAGLIVPMGDVAAIARGMRMLDDDALRARLGRAARARDQDFTVDRIAGQDRALFEGAAKGGRP